MPSCIFLCFTVGIFSFWHINVKVMAYAYIKLLESLQCLRFDKIIAQWHTHHITTPDGNSHMAKT